MRKLITGVLVGALMLVVAAVAMGASATSGGTVQNYDQTFSAKKPNTSVGTTFSTTSTDESNPRNKQPKRVTNFDLTFPKGTKIDNKAIPQCKATESDFANQADNPDKACPKGSKIGAGTVSARLPFQSADLTGTVRGYNANKGLILYVAIQSPLGTQTLVLTPKFQGLNLKTIVPATCIPPTRADQGCKDANGQEQVAVLTGFKLTTKPMSAGKGAKKKALITSPKTCTGGKWAFEANIKYADGTGVKIPTTSACAKK
jgi:hypothetical protein